MKTLNKFNSTQTSSLNKYYNILSISNLKLINKPKIYHPINPSHPFNFDLLNFKEISKRKNALLINNKPLKDKILKYSMDERKNSNENNDPNKYLFNKFKDEEKKYQLTIRAILKNNIDNFPLYLSERKSREKKKKKINLKINISRNDVNLNPNKLRYITSYSQIKSKYSKDKNILFKDNGISQYIPKNKKLKINKLNLKSLGIKMKLSQTTNKFKLLRNYKKSESKTNIIKKHLSFSVTNMKSNKLGIISIFGVFEEIGVHGRIICSTIINYLIDYFKSSNEMNVCIDKNNFYSILHWSFLNAQNYLIQNEKKLKIDLTYSGCMACFLLQPKNNSNKIYCANSGICKCLLYTNRGPDIFSFSLTIDRPSEKDRIYIFLRNKKISQILNSMVNKDSSNNNKDKKSKKKKNNNKKNDEKKNTDDYKSEMDNDNDYNSNNDNLKEDENQIHNENLENIKEETKTNIKKEKIKINEEELQSEQEKSIKYFKVFGFTRAFGILSGANYGLVPDPEVIECDLKSNKVKYIILGNCTFWKLLNEIEIGNITAKYVSNKDIIGVNKEFGDLIRQKVGTNSKLLDKCGFEIIYLDNFL